MLSGGSWFDVHSPVHGLILLCIAITLLVQKSASVVVPSSNCYVIDNSSRIFDFTDLMGHHFEYEGKGSPDVVVRFCKDVESRSQQVHNGLTQLGFDKSHNDFSFETEQTHVSLYMTAVASLSSLVGKPDVKVNPDTGLVVELSGSGTNGRQPATLSPTVLTVSWRCEQARDIPYEVAISIPVDGYDPTEFILTKKCEYKSRIKKAKLLEDGLHLACFPAYSLCYPLDFVVVASYIRQELNISMGWMPCQG